MDDPNEVRDAVRTCYAELALLASNEGVSCCGEEAACFGTSGYSVAELAELPEAAALASLGCGNPIVVAELAAGEVVLDLGSGGGIDVILSARGVGPTGKAYGLDMTDEMLALGAVNAAAARTNNVEFLKGQIEDIPLPDGAIDVVISNCVINLSTDKAAVLSEVARVLRPGGRLAVSDVIADPDLDEATRRHMAAWTGCVAGALTEETYRHLLV